MARWRTYEMECQHCGEVEPAMMFDMDTETPDDPSSVQCLTCKEWGVDRLFGMNTIGFNTSKMSNTYPDGVRKFDKRRAERKLENTIRQAKNRGDTDTLIGATKEALERGAVVKGIKNNKTTQGIAKKARKD